MNFEEWGTLEWLEPEEFYADAWETVETAIGEDGEKYDIVRLRIGNTVECEYRYTCI